MDRLNAVIEHPLYREHYSALIIEEKDRTYCGHDMDHLLDVARVCYIYCLEDGLTEKYPKEIIYAAALLHDIGRHEENASGIPHEKAGAQLAAIIMEDAGYSKNEIKTVSQAIGGHRSFTNDGSLAEYLFRADKGSRKCYSCKAIETCKWEKDKMNLKVEV